MKLFEYNFALDKKTLNKIYNSVIFDSHKKEKEILYYLTQKKTCEEISKLTNFSERTIQNRRKDIYKKISKYIIDENYYVDENIFKVYILIFPNGKVYVGMCINQEKRWDNGKGYIQNIKMYDDILKYGWNNIVKKIIYKNLSYEEARQKEKEMIINYKSNIKKYGYNKQF